MLHDARILLELLVGEVLADLAMDLDLAARLAEPDLRVREDAVALLGDAAVADTLERARRAGDVLVREVLDRAVLVQREVAQRHDLVAVHLERRQAEDQLRGERAGAHRVAHVARVREVQATDFAAEVMSIDYSNLVYQMAKAVLRHIATEKTEPYREALRSLFDEGTPLQERIDGFRSDIEKVYREMGETLGTHHDERTIATFLTFRYPEKYNLYKNTVYKSLCSLLTMEPVRSPHCYVHHLELTTDLIDNYISKDNELLELVKSFLTPDCYADANHRILVQDILYQMLDKKGEQDKPVSETRRFWVYAPGENGGQWDRFHAAGIMGMGWMSGLSKYESRHAIEAEAHANSQFPNRTEQRLSC